MLFGSTLCSCLIGEIIVRITGFAPDVGPIEIDKPTAKFVSVENPNLKYIPRPNFQDINSYGIRDRVVEIEKSAGLFRIVVIGDSIAFGYCTDTGQGLPIETTFPRVLEQRLNRLGPGGRRFEVINLSVPGYDTRQELEFLKLKGLALSPDLVLVSYCLNDRWDASGVLAMFKGSPNWIDGSKPVLAFFIRHSSLTRLLWQRLRTLRKPSTTPSGPRPKYYERPIEDRRVEDSFDRLSVLSKAHGFSVLTVVFPVFEIGFDRYSQTPWIQEHWFIDSVVSSRNLYLLDLTAAFTASVGADYKSLREPCERMHPNERGHAIAAATIADFVLEHIPTSARVPMGT